MNDADLETIELCNRAMDAHNGICVHCDDALDPTDPKWAGESFCGMTPEAYAKVLGPARPGQPYHERCWDDIWKDF